MLLLISGLPGSAGHFAIPFFYSAAVVSSSLQGTDTWRGWGPWGAGADGFGFHTESVALRVQKDSGETKGEIDSLSDSLAIARIV